MWDEGGCCSIIKDEIESMEFVEHNTTIGRNVMNEDYIEDFSSVEVLMRTVSIPGTVNVFCTQNMVYKRKLHILLNANLNYKTNTI